MLKLSLVLIALAAPLAGATPVAQAGGPVPPQTDGPTPGRLLNSDFLTSTGATVPRPGLPQSAGPSELDQSIERKNDQIDNSICKGC